MSNVDRLEDALKELAPSIVVSDQFLCRQDCLNSYLATKRTVRIPSLEQGTNALRLLSIRHLPSTEEIVQSTFPTSSSTSPHAELKPSALLPEPNPQDPGPDIPSGVEEPGTYVNLEVGFSYRRLPPKMHHRSSVNNTDNGVEGHGEGENAHFLLYLGLGVVCLSSFFRLVCRTD